MTAIDGRSEVSFRVMRVDTAINSGNSGGGLYDDEGCLIGIANAKIVNDGVEMALEITITEDCLSEY